MTASADRARAARDSTGLAFVAEMYGVQLDQLSLLLGVSDRQAAALVARWSQRNLADSAILSPGPRWVWITRPGLQACGLRYSPSPPALPRLAHIRAVTSVRLALTAAPAYQLGQAHWRSERRMRARLGGRLGAREHVPDAEVHWPDGEMHAPGATATGAIGWAGECWAIEAELTPKTVARTTSIMGELLARTGDYGCPAAEVSVPGAPPRYARAIYLCTAAAARTVERARANLGNLGPRVEIRPLPDQAYLQVRTPA